MRVHVGTAEDLSQTIHRARCFCNGRIGTVIPNMAVYYLKDRRLITGKEAMQLQGYPPDKMQYDFLSQMGISDCTLRSIAGNAFAGQAAQ